MFATVIKLAVIGRSREMVVLIFDHTDEPKLPPELEECIFALAFDERPSEAWSYLFVAKRVHTWLIPRIFNIVVLTESAGESSPARFNPTLFESYAKHTRYLYLGSPKLFQHLPLFTNLVDLVMSSGDCDPAYLEVLLNLKDLTRLSIAMSDSTPSPSYFKLFAKVTHLDLNSFSRFWDLEIIKPYIDFPLLTHLCVIAGSNADVIKPFLDRKRCQNLEVVVLWHTGQAHDGWDTIITPEDSIEEFPCEDERIIPVSVVTVVGDWENGAKGRDDMWKIAEKEVALRKMAT